MKTSQDGDNYGTLGSFISTHSKAEYEEFLTALIS